MRLNGIEPSDHYQRMLFLGIELGEHCRGREHIDGPSSLPWFLPTDWAQAWWCWKPGIGTYVPFINGEPVRFGHEFVNAPVRP